MYNGVSGILVICDKKPNRFTIIEQEGQEHIFGHSTAFFYALLSYGL